MSTEKTPVMMAPAGTPGIVVEMSDAQCIHVQVGDNTVNCRLSLSCVFVPHPGDKVLVWADPTGEEAYVLSILDRVGDQSASICVEGALNIQSQQGDITLASGGNIHHYAKQGLHLKSKNTTLRSEDLTLCTENTTWTSKTWTVSADTMRLLAKQAEWMLQTLYQRCRDYFRRTECLENSKAGQVQNKVEGLYSLDTTNTIMVSKKDTKIDGERIHMA